MDCVGVPGRGNHDPGQNAADLAAMIAAMQDDMGQHLLPGHAALVAIGESESDRLRKSGFAKGFEIVEIPAVACLHGGAQLGWLGRSLGVVARVTMGDPGEMRREY